MDEELPQLRGYFGILAQKLATARRQRRRKLVRSDDVLGAAIAGLKAGWSPEQIAGRMRHEGQARSVSHESIYAYVYSADGQGAALARYLPERRKRRKPHHARKPRGNVFPPDRAVQNYPQEVAAREAFGNWEGDLMIFQRSLGSTNVASLVEHKTRLTLCCSATMTAGRRC